MSEIVFKSNSDKSRRIENSENIIPKERCESVISGNASIKKKSFWDKILANVISPDITDVSGEIKSYLWKYGKNALLDIIEMLLNGDAPNMRRSSAMIGRYSYDKQYVRANSYSNRNELRSEESRDTASLNYDSIEFDRRGDAELVLDRMRSAITEFDSVSILDMYDMAGISCDNYALNKYGWINLTHASVARNMSGRYVINLPKARPFN